MSDTLAQKTAYRIIDVECIARAKALQVKPDRHCENGSISWRDGKESPKWCDHLLCNSIQVRHLRVPFSWRDGQNHQMMWPPSYATASRCVNTSSFFLARPGQNHQMMWPPAMQQHPGGITTVPFHGETDRITKWCDHQLCNSIQVRHYGSISWRDELESPRAGTRILRPVSHPPIVHSFVGTARTSGAVPPALNASLRFLFRGETDRITKWCDHQLCNSIQVRHYGSFFLARRTESPNDVTTSYATASRCVTTEVLHLFRCSTHTLSLDPWIIDSRFTHSFFHSFSHSFRHSFI